MRLLRLYRVFFSAAVLFSLFLLIVVVGCDRPSDHVTIRFWNGFTGPDGRTMLGLVRQFNQDNPDVRVLMQRMEWPSYYNKLFVAGLGQRAPEVCVIHTDVLERFIQAGFVYPVDNFLKGEHGIDVNDFDENVWKAVEKESKHYALPLDVHPLGLYYNKTLFCEAGIVDASGNAKPPINQQVFIDAALKITRDLDGDGTIDQWGFVYTWFRTNVYAMMAQWGGPIFNNEGNTCLLNSPENVQALQFCVDLIHKYQVAPPPENYDAWIGFRQGKIGMAFEGIYMLADLEKQTDLDYAGSPIPKLGKVKATWASSHNLCIRSDLDEDKQVASWRFIKYLTDHSVDWAKGGQIPVRKSLRNSEAFHSLEIQNEFANQIPYVHYMPRVPYIFEFYSEFDLAIEKALRGSATPKAALDVATENINKVIERHKRLFSESRTHGDEQ